jgi:hypothetical protein
VPPAHPRDTGVPHPALAPQTAQFVVTGNPRFDALARRPAPSARPSTPFTITICTGFVSDFSTAASE